jgi:hypothetical protein
MKSHLNQEHKESLSECIENAEECIDAAQLIVDKCSMMEITPLDTQSLTDQEECGSGRGLLLRACNAVIDSCKDVLKFTAEHTNICQDNTCKAICQELLESCLHTMQVCSASAYECREDVSNCSDVSLELIDACQDCAQKCDELL